MERLLTVLEKLFPKKLAEKPTKKLINPPYKLLLTNDVTDSVVEEAMKNEVSMIISYHPIIFSGLKRLTHTDRVSRIILDCAVNGIGIYSYHTSCDCVVGGVNDWLVSGIGGTNSRPIEPNSTIEGAGSGRICEINPPISFDELINRVKKTCNIDHVRISKPINTEKLIKKVAVCAGSGGSLFKSLDADIDAYFTGEMSHHEVLDLVSKGSFVILTNHSNNERGYLQITKNKLESELGDKYPIIISNEDHDPLVVG